MGSATSAKFLRNVHIPVTLLAAVGLDGILYPQQAKLVDNDEYDYIVVGGGTAGCIITTRLAQNKRNNTVLMLEAGDDPPVTALLAGFYDVLPQSSVDYNYTSALEELAAGGQDNTLHSMIIAGKMLGGSASLNHFMYLRGTPQDYDSWAKISKDKSWRYENVLKYFITAERLNDAELLEDRPNYYGTEGPLGVGRQPFKEAQNYLAAFEEAGSPTVLDLTGEVSLGYTEPLYTVADQKRQTPAFAYLKLVKDYRNLYVSKNTRVIKILFVNKVAVAVKAVHKGVTFTFKARKEIIVCAGVFGTPQLLMLSGVGPKHHLKAMNIDLKADLPVGENLRDHVSVTLVHKVNTYTQPMSIPGGFLLDPTAIPVPNIIGSVALEKSQTYPDYQTYSYILEHDTWYLTLVCKSLFGYRKDICDNWQQQAQYKNSMYTTVAHMQPQSTGTVRLQSIDPFDKSLIKTGYYSKKKDLDDMLKYVKHFIAIGETDYFKKMGAELIGTDIPDCEQQMPYSDAFWNCYIVTLSCSTYDFSGTCAMGSVVDSKLKVKGFEKLRIADASVIPRNLRGRINAAVIVIAEKASDMILKDNIF